MAEASQFGEIGAVAQVVNDTLREHSHSGSATSESSGGYLFHTMCRCGWNSSKLFTFGEATDEWRQHQTDAVLDALGLEQVGWEHKPPGWPSWRAGLKNAPEGGIAPGVLVLDPDWKPHSGSVNLAWRPVFAATGLTRAIGVLRQELGLRDDSGRGDER